MSARRHDGPVWPRVSPRSGRDVRRGGRRVRAVRAGAGVRRGQHVRSREARAARDAGVGGGQLVVMEIKMYFIAILTLTRY